MDRRLLLVEDDININRIICDYFSSRKYVVDAVFNGTDALKHIDENAYDIVLLDIMLPGMDGFEVCRKIRKEKDVPILFISSLSDEENILNGYDTGADDYITKPFSISILCAKVESLLKRYRNLGNDGIIRIDGLLVNPKKHLINVNGKEVFLPRKEFEILMYLLDNRGIILSRQQILDVVWKEDYSVYDRVVDTHIKKLRALLENESGHIVTVAGSGYYWK